LFRQCTVAGQISNAHGVENEETRNSPQVLVCREIRTPWPEFWKGFQYFA